MALSPDLRAPGPHRAWCPPYCVVFRRVCWAHTRVEDFGNGEWRSGTGGHGAQAAG